MHAFLSVLPYLVYALLAAFLIGWVVLGIACTRKQRFWPILRTDKATKAFWLVALLLVNPVLTVLYLLFGQLRRPDASAGRIAPIQVAMAALVVAVAGFFVNFPGLTHFWMVPFVGVERGDDDDSRFDAHLATIESRSSISTTVARTSGSHGGLSLRRVAITNESEGVLASLLARTLRTEIARLPSVDDVQLYAVGQSPPPGSVRPDMFVRVSVRNVRVTPIPYAMGLSAHVDVQAGPAPWRGMSLRVAGAEMSAPELDLHASIDHESRTVGYESVRHGLAAKSIAGEIAERLRADIDASLREYGPMPALPRSFWGDYRPAELPAPLGAVPSECLGSYSGLLAHNETHWRLRVPGEDLAAFFGRVETGLSAANWTLINRVPSELCMEKGPARVRVFKAPARVETGWTFTSDTNVESGTPPADVIACYRERFSDDEKKAAIDGLLASEASPAVLLSASDLMGPEQRQRMHERLQQAPCVSVPVALDVAEYYLSQGLLENADAAIRRARAALWTLADREKPAGGIKATARQIAEAVAKQAGTSVPTPTPSGAPLSASDFHAAGFREVGAGSLPADFEVGLDEPAAFFSLVSGKELRTMALTVRGRFDPSLGKSYEALCVESSPGAWSSCVIAGQNEGGAWRARHIATTIGVAIEVEVTGTDRPGRFRVSVRPRT